MPAEWLPVIKLVGASCAAAVLGYLLGKWRGASKASRGVRRETSQELDDARQRAQRLHRDLSDSEKKHHRMLELLLNLPETVNKIGAARSNTELCRTTARALMEYCGASRIGLFVPERSSGRFVLEVYGGGVRPTQDVAFVPGEGRLGSLSKWIGVRSARDLDPGTLPVGFADELFRADLTVAMRRHEDTYAFAVLDDTKQDDQLIRRVVQMIADVHAVSAEGVRALDDERLKADLDQLTGLYNRRHLDRRLPDELARAQSYGMAVSVFLFDVDNFKHYNDTNGHQPGDGCLQAVAHLARQVTRGSDVVCRYGGEEFLVILLGADGQQAFFHADRIRQAIAAAPIAHAAQQPLGCVSVSGGVASFPADAGDAASLIKLADAALYRAKETGRNRVLRVDPALDQVRPTP
ncbi:MAG: GGDEF domain-containing protein [Pseudomonadota bacterium]